MLGKQINNYRITRLIGEGGMASVYEAEHVTLYTKVAIKVMKPELLVIDNIKARFLQEAQIMAGLDHPHIVRVIDYVEEGSTMAIVMEYLEGEDLSEKIKRGGALSAEASKGIFAPVLDAFIYAHGKGLVHRDVKPSNIFVCKNGSVKIMDFGIAKLIDGNNSLTRTGAQMGTPTYMSPEQVEESKHIDQRSDIYSLGVTLFYMLDGSAPYDSTVSNFAIFNRIHNEPLPRLEGIESNMRSIIDKATSKKASDRFSSCEEFKSALFKVARGSNVPPVLKISDSTVVESEENPLVQDHTKRPQPSPQERRVTSEESLIPKKKKFPIVLLLVLLLVSGVGVYLYNSYQERESAIEAQSQATLKDKSSYSSAKETNSIASYEGYIKSYPQGKYVNVAQEAIAVLKHQQDLVVQARQQAASAQAREAQLEAQARQQAASAQVHKEQLDDGDGVADKDDKCPTVPGKFQGCPDTDGDGFPDNIDQCPDVAGSVNGCPDSDGDGIPDKDDQCPTLVGSIANHGCPDLDGDGVADKDDALPDQDGDGFPDQDDKCPTVPGKFQGCPDTDGDGFPDNIDQCPDVAGSVNGCPDPDGDGVADKDDALPSCFVPSDFVYVVGGTFNMGSTSGEDDEQPVHSVTLSSFLIEKYEVTFAQYDTYCELAGISKPSDNGWGRGNRPVINVSWNDAEAYCVWLSAQTGKHYCLPTEAEWEYAARGGNKSNNYKYSGSDDLGSVGWYKDNSGNMTHPVGLNRSNELGIYDMSGNVWEWCSDWYGGYRSASQDDPQGPTTRSIRVLRGGSWFNDAQNCRSTRRNSYTPGTARNGIGFRVALVL